MVRFSSRNQVATRRDNMIRLNHFACTLVGAGALLATGALASADRPNIVFDLSTDPGEQTNLRDKHPQTVERLTSTLEDYLQRRRSAPHTSGIRGDE